MTRKASTWKSYVSLLSQVAAHYGVTLAPAPATAAEDEALMLKFMADLKAAHPVATVLLETSAVSEKHFRNHIRYIARWGTERRRLLAEGANFQLVQGLEKQEQAGQLDGLVLQGRLVEQRRALSAHLQGKVTMPEGVGWLAPVPGDRIQARLYGSNDVAWIYADGAIDFSEGLHPKVARSLIAFYMPEAGVLVDPMAGSGVVPRMATEMGHRAWASDIAPAHSYIRRMNLSTTDLGAFFGDEYGIGADLVVIHPPLPGTLKKTQGAYNTWLGKILAHCWGAVKGGGHLVLIVPLTAESPVLSHAEQILRRTAGVAFNRSFDQLTASHLAVARTGKEGWHLLVLQSPTTVEQARP